MNDEEKHHLLSFDDLGSSNHKTYPENKSLLNNIFGKPRVKKESYKESDLFYEDIYDYFYRDGSTNIIISNASEFFLIVAGLAFMFFIFVLLDWDLLLQCGTNGDSCGDIALFIRLSEPNLLISLLLICGVIFLLYRIIDFYIGRERLKFVKRYYTDKLKITDRDLQTMPWYEILKKIEILTGVSSYDITNRILRKENYYMAILHNNVITLSQNFYTNQLEINLKFVLLHDLENITISGMKRRFYFLGFLNLLICPIIFFYLIFYFFVSNIEEVYSNANNINSRRFCLLTKWKIRQYNEMKHFFEQRINRAVPLSYRYLRQFPNPFMENIGKSVALICGIFFTFNLFISILDENIVLYIKIFDRSLLFYTGIMGAISAGARSFIKRPENSVYNPKKAMEQIQKCTRYLPLHWKNKFHTYDTRDEFLKIFPYKLQLLFYDLLSVLTTPFILFFSLSSQSDRLFDFIKMNSIYVPNIGNICSFSYFDSSVKNVESSMILFEENHGGLLNHETNEFSYDYSCDFEFDFESLGKGI